MRFSNDSLKATTKEGMESWTVRSLIDEYLRVNVLLIGIIGYGHVVIFTFDIFSDETAIKTKDPKV